MHVFVDLHLQLLLLNSTFDGVCILMLIMPSSVQLFERLSQAVSLNAHQAFLTCSCLILSLQRSDGWLVLLIVILHPLDILDQLVLFL